MPPKNKKLLLTDCRVCGRPYHGSPFSQMDKEGKPIDEFKKLMEKYNPNFRYTIEVLVDNCFDWCIPCLDKFLQIIAYEVFVIKDARDDYQYNQRKSYWLGPGVKIVDCVRNIFDEDIINFVSHHLKDCARRKAKGLPVEMCQGHFGVCTYFALMLNPNGIPVCGTHKDNVIPPNPVHNLNWNNSSIVRQIEREIADLRIAARHFLKRDDFEDYKDYHTELLDTEVVVPKPIDREDKIFYEASLNCEHKYERK